MRGGPRGEARSKQQLAAAAAALEGALGPLAKENANSRGERAGHSAFVNRVPARVGDGGRKWDDETQSLSVRACAKLADAEEVKAAGSKDTGRKWEGRNPWSATRFNASRPRRLPSVRATVCLFHSLSLSLAHTRTLSV